MKLQTAVFYCVLATATQLICGSTALSAQTATVAADFGARSNTAHRIPPDMFGTNLASLQTGTAALLPLAGITEGRRVSNISLVYATTTPNWSQFDWAMNQAKTAGMHPLVVLSGTPKWLQPSPNPCPSSPEMAPPVNFSSWAGIAAAYVAHLNQAFPGLVQDFEIWNEPELQQSFCVANNTDASRLSTYLSLYAAAASAMRTRAKQDGVNIHIGGPTISRLSLAPEWIAALLSNAQTAPNVDFVSFHFYPTGLAEIQGSMTWSSLYTRTQSASNGLPFYYSQISSLVKKGSQPNPGSTPVYLTEYNDNWSFTKDCCRNDPAYAPLWNAAAVADLLNSVYGGANAPGKIYYFAGSMPPFCLFGAWDSAMDCNTSQMEPYPQYYLYQLLASNNYLGLEEGGYMAASIIPASTQSGLMATAFYTPNSDSIVIINPTATDYSRTTIEAKNSGYATANATLYLLDEAHGQIQLQSLILANGSNGLSATIAVPAYSTVAVKINGSVSKAPPTAVLTVTPPSGPAPTSVTADSSGSSDSDGSIASRSIDFGDGSAVATNKVSAAHTYTAPGSYSVNLTITDNAGLSSQAGKVVTISKTISGPPKAVLTLTPRLGTAPLQIVADSSQSSDNGAAVASRSIDFGDGSTPAKTISASHVYSKAGTYNAKLVVTGKTGLSSQATQTVRVESLQNAGFESGTSGWQFRSPSDGSVQSIALNAHSGNRDVELTSSAQTHPECFAIDSLDGAIYFPVVPGQTITFGGWAYRVSGDGLGRWAIELRDANKTQALYVAAASASAAHSAAQGTWTHQQTTFVVPAGKSFVRFYADIYKSTMASKFRFDDAVLLVH